ncbi:chymotrypsin-1-like, partial [Teleopsis dalmanni]
IDAKRITVRIGSVNQYAGGEIREIEEVRIHPSYGNFLHDVALLFFTESLEFNDKYNKIWFAGADDVIEDRASVTVAGWGLLSTGATPYKLQETKMTVLSAPECEYEAGYGYESILCLQHPVNEGICRGDDGAGVYVDGILYGVISFAFGSCGTKYPDIASKVSYYEEWINNNH